MTIDSMGYKCCKPPVWMHISSQYPQYPSALGGRPSLDSEEKRDIAAFLLADHSTVEAAARFHKNRRTIGEHMRRAGCVYNGHRKRWEVGT